MDAKEFKREALHVGYAYAPTVKDYMEMYDEPYTQDDLQNVYRLQAYRDARGLRASAQGDLHGKRSMKTGGNDD